MAGKRTTVALEGWQSADSEVGREVETVSRETLAAYREAPRFVEEHANLERAAVEGGYGRRQLFELIQNGADELLGSTGRVTVVLTESALYCANEGKPLSVQGVGALLSSHLSAKQGVEIGRFGLGFKSVLGISKRPAIYSRSGSIVFDPEKAAARIEEVVPGSKRVPVLRIAEAVSADDAAEDDPVLAELMSWATTVVKLTRDTEDSSWLSRDIAEFPSQFLLFSPHVRELALEDRDEGVSRLISARTDGESIVLTEQGQESEWRVFALEHEPSDAARRDAGAMAERDRIPLVWAVPTRRSRIGEFWAFFPTLDQTTLSGVVNAPWKLNEDRTRIIEGPFNEELLKQIALTVIERAPELCPADDPGLLLELMPARGREARGWADEVVTAEINELAAYSPSIPDQTGELELPTRIELHPEGVPPVVLRMWHDLPSRPTDWAHPSVETTIRRARVEMYMEPKRAATVDEWLGALIGADPVEGSVAAVKVAAALLDEEPGFRDALRDAAIVALEGGALRKASEPGIYRPAPLPIEVPALYVHERLLADEAARSALERLGIPQIDAVRVLEAIVRKGTDGWKAKGWDLFWELVRKSPEAETIRVLDEAGLGRFSLRVRNMEGEYQPLGGLLLPGEIVTATPDDADSTIDTSFHREELRILQTLGAVRGPSERDGLTSEPWFAAYKRLARDEYLKRLKGSGSAPNVSYLDFRVRKFAGPLTPLASLSPAARLRFTEALLGMGADLEPWTFGHKSQSRYPELRVPHPAVWLIKSEGILRTSLGPRTCKSAVGPALTEFHELLPVADCSVHTAELLGLPGVLEDLDEHRVTAFFEQAAESDHDRAVGHGYAAAAAAGLDRPDQLRCRVGSIHDCRDPEEVVVTDDPDLVSVLTHTSQPFVHVPTATDAEALIERWGLREGGSTVRSETAFVPTGEAEPLGDRYPMLRLRLDSVQREMLLLPCAELRLERFTDTGRVTTDRRFVAEGSTLYYAAELDESALLRELSRALGLDLDEADVDAVIRNLDAQRSRELRATIRDANDDEERLLQAVGPDALRSHIPASLLDAVSALEGELSDRDVAQLALVVHGAKVLQEHAADLELQGLEPPTRWAGSRQALQFVRELGFPAEFAGWETPRMERLLEVEGPPALGPLHDYQEIVVEDLRCLIRGEGGLRGLLSLPTGAGKTRVTIEALVQSLIVGEVGGPILWIAQTEELCEQAVQSWSEVWRGLGPRQRLTISRLWSKFEADEVETGHQVVVATIQKLSAGVFAKKSYDWLAASRCIVVDEAHSSIGPSYTALLEWQGMARNKDRVPLIGLTATPYRGINLAETERLAGRYGSRRLDLRALGGTDAYPHLQELGILAHVDHRILEGSDIKLSPDELAQLKRMRQLPDTASRVLGGDVDRNRTLLESILSLDDDWPVLVFAVSVEHAQTMAALLTREGVPAAAISGDMDRGLRRHYIDQFRTGELRVLTNYAVLTAGFDAPKVRALYVARPTYTPNIYQQMVGRGLRGPKNGGTDRCLLVNVRDNVSQFGEQLAFHEFDYLWSEGSNGSG